MTAQGLLTALAPYQFIVEEDELVGREPPPELLSRLAILHTELRALLTGKKWHGSAVADGKRPRILELAPRELIPMRIMLLCVEGDSGWDRIPASARLDLPNLFAPEGT